MEGVGKIVERLTGWSRPDAAQLTTLVREAAMDTHTATPMAIAAGILAGIWSPPWLVAFAPQDALTDRTGGGMKAALRPPLFV